MKTKDLIKINRSSRNTFLAALIVIMAMSIYSWLVTPYTTYLSAKQRYDTATNDIGKRGQTIKKVVESRKQKLQGLKGQISELYANLFSSIEAESFFNNLQVVCTKNNCVISSLHFSEQGASEQKLKDKFAIDVKSTELTIVGSYQNIANFIRELQATGKKVWLESIEMEAFDKNSSTIKCDMVITVYVNLQKENHPNE